MPNPKLKYCSRQRAQEVLEIADAMCKHYIATSHHNYQFALHFAALVCWDEHLGKDQALGKYFHYYFNLAFLPI